MLFLFSGEVQPAVSPNPRTEVNSKFRNPEFFLKIWIESISLFIQVDGPTRRGLPVFQAHPGDGPLGHPPYGNAPCKKELVITLVWFASDSAR